MPLTMAANVWVWACDGFWNRGLRITSIIEFATSDVFLLGSLFFFSSLSFSCLSSRLAISTCLGHLAAMIAVLSSIYLVALFTLI